MNRVVHLFVFYDILGHGLAFHTIIMQILDFMSMLFFRVKIFFQLLLFVQAGIVAILRQQLVVRSLLYYFAFVQHNDLVEITMQRRCIKPGSIAP